jgi:eukaryotic-like serine/threonine-protein kinase
MDNDWLTRLTQATSDDERAALVLAMSLVALPAGLPEVVQAAAIPHWFDAQFLTALLGEESDAWYDHLLTLSFVDQVPGRGYAIHERTRRQLLHRLWRDDPDRFRELSGRAAAYCRAQATANGEAAWQAEAVYHQLVSEPEAGVAGLRDLATRWANYEYHTYDEIEATVRLAQEQIETGRLRGVGADWTRLWQAKLALLYGRPQLAEAPLAQITAVDCDLTLAAEVAQTRGDLLATQGDRDGMAIAWQTAYDLYRQMHESQGRLDAYLLAEKMARHGLPLPEAERPTVTGSTTPPGSTALRLIDNIEAAWIEGVLKTAVSQTLDLRLARDGGRPANLVFHRPGTLDRPLAAGQRLSGLFAAAGESLLILGAPGSGKTITLLQLLQELLQTARADGQASIPLLFNLSSFAAFARKTTPAVAQNPVNENGAPATVPATGEQATRAPLTPEKKEALTGWLAEQAYAQYRLNRTTTREQLAAGRFVLLLDGLDEVSNEAGQREQCITAINDFMARTPCGLVVCSRIRDYRVLQNRLALAHALVLQPLSNGQIERFIRELPVDSEQYSVNSEQYAVGEPGAMLTRLEADWQLREALRSPLLLNLYPQAFAALPPEGDGGATVESRRQALFAAYVETVFERPETAGERAKEDAGDKEKSLGWLRFLAGRMQQHGSSLFFVEALQPTWLPEKLTGRYRGLYGLLLGLIGGLIFGLVGVLANELILGLVGVLAGGLIFGLAGAGASWLTTPHKKPWLRVGLGGLIAWLIVGLILVVIFGLSGGLVSLTGRLSRTLFLSLIVGLGVGLIVGLGLIISLGVGSLVTNIQLREQVKLLRPPRHRVFYYLRRGILLGLIVGLIVGLSNGLMVVLSVEASVWVINGPSELLYPGLSEVLLLGLIGGLLGGLLGGLIGGLLGFVMAFLDTPAVDERPYPGSGVSASLRNALLMTVLAAFFFGLPAWLIGRQFDAEFFILLLVLVNILPPTFTWFGGLAWCQHWALRFILARRSWMPWRLVPWLDRMVARGLLRRVSGGYIFIHRSLLEHFASLEGEQFKI